MGYTMQHWIQKGGAFEDAVQAMPDDYFPWRGDIKPKTEKKKPFKYLCNTCGACFAIPLQLHLTCNTKGCNQVMEIIEGIVTPESLGLEPQKPSSSKVKLVA